jgi:hypothetical protein
MTSQVDTPPTTRRPFNIVEWYEGDTSRVQLAIKHLVTGPDTLGHPATGYDEVLEAGAIVGQIHNASGHVEHPDADGGDGRTMVPFMKIGLGQSGLGDVVGIGFTGFMDSVNPGSTSVFGNGNLILMNGSVISGVEGAYLNVSEFNLSDRGHACLGIGHIIGLDRTNPGTEGPAGDAVWYGFRAQSIGSVETDALYSGYGKTKMGIDFTSLQTMDAGPFTKAAVVLSAGDRLYFDGIPGVSPACAVSAGSAFLAYDTALGRLRAVGGLEVDVLTIAGDPIAPRLHAIEDRLAALERIAELERAAAEGR